MSCLSLPFSHHSSSIGLVARSKTHTLSRPYECLSEVALVSLDESRMSLGSTLGLLGAWAAQETSFLLALSKLLRDQSTT